VACRAVARRLFSGPQTAPEGSCFALSAKQQLNSNRDKYFLCSPCRFVIRRAIGALNELVVGQSPVGNKMSKEAGDIVGIHHHTTMVKTMQTEKI
jgi:hypothetical protein